MMTEDQRAEARANVIFCDGKATADCKTCGGRGEVWKYFRHEEQQVIDQVYDLCPICFPDLTNPICQMKVRLRLGIKNLILCTTQKVGRFLEAHRDVRFHLQNFLKKTRIISDSTCVTRVGHRYQVVFTVGRKRENG